MNFKNGFKDSRSFKYTFFANIVKNLEINQLSNFDPVVNNVKDPTLKVSKIPF